MQALHHHTIMVCVPAKSTISGVEDAKLVFSALLVNPDVVEGSLSVTMYPGPSLPATPACPGAALTEG